MCGLAAVLAAAMLRPSRRAAIPVVVAATALGLVLVAASAMLVLDLIGSIFPGIGIGRYPLGAASRVGCATTGLLLTLAARSFLTRSGVALPVGERIRSLTAPLDDTPRWAYVAGYVSMTGCLTRLIAQVIMGLDESPLSSGVAGIAFELCFVLAGTLLPLALVHSWGRAWPRWVIGLAGRRVPRRLVLLPGIAVSAMIVVYFGAMLAQMVAEHLQGRNPFPPDGGMNLPEAFFWVAVPAYFVWGAALAVATLSYHRRTRSRGGRESLAGGMGGTSQVARLEA